MAYYKNLAVMRGNLGADAELATSNNGQPRLSGTIYVNHNFKKKDENGADKWQCIVTKIKWVIWGNLATTMNRVALKKGDYVELEGELRPNNWIDSQTGEHHDEIYLLVSSAQKFVKPSQARENKTQENSQFDKGLEDNYDGEDVPF